ncbi:MAG: class I tRNA ligase family protein, partial [Ferruginibacter sp.]
AFGEVNWCEALGTVLANDEVLNGFSERGGHPVIKKKMHQWFLRTTVYADRLLDGLKNVDFSDSMKEMQKNWIGKSEGAEIIFNLDGHNHSVKVYTTRPETIFGVDFIVLAPEHELVEKITSSIQAEGIANYLEYVKTRSDRERLAEVKQVTGAFTGAYAKHPFSEKKLPIWISEYVLAGYGTGAIMAVPCGDQRDFNFAKHFNISITNIIGDKFNKAEANPTYQATLENSDFLNGLEMKEAMKVCIDHILIADIGKRKVNYKMRDAGFSRQRYWGEPFPVLWKEGIAIPLDESQLPLLLPHLQNYKPGPNGEGPLANETDWVTEYGNETRRETSTMPGYAGSSWYFLRYMDPHNDEAFCSRKASDYWGQVDVYIGGTEHAVGHLLYSRMWTKVLYDLGFIGFDEPFKRLINQGMITGSSRFAYRFKQDKNIYVSQNKRESFYQHWLMENSFDEYAKKLSVDSQNSENVNSLVWEYISKNENGNGQFDLVHVDVNIVDGVEMDIEAFKSWKVDFNNAEIITEDDGSFICDVEIEKMSKSKYNTVNPDDLVNKYGADTFRMYEMFLGPVEQSKPWDTKGIEGVHRFLRKFWRLFNNEIGKVWDDSEPSKEEFKILHRTIKKIEQDTENFAFNTAVSAFMVCVNELTELKCSKKKILEQLLVLITPYAPHISQELWNQLENPGFILNAEYPIFNAEYLLETSHLYPISVNGKMRTSIEISLSAEKDQIEALVLENDVIQKWLDGKMAKKIIIVPGKMVNVVV